jgi:hypothetical protein
MRAALHGGYGRQLMQLLFHFISLVGQSGSTAANVQMGQHLCEPFSFKQGQPRGIYRVGIPRFEQAMTGPPMEAGPNRHLEQCGIPFAGLRMMIIVSELCQMFPLIGGNC